MASRPLQHSLSIKSPHLSENNPPPPEPTASTIINLGTIPLSISPSTGIIKGTITDADSAQPLEGVTIEVTGSFSGSTVTGTDGSFIITEVTPGEITITASKTGYYCSTAGVGLRTEVYETALTFEVGCKWFLGGNKPDIVI